ncbi:nickel pincer cofactor biosynthesis protein LarC [Deferrisoma camini]|uniref:LarC family nickel insertion protein n=1 Tax=Deferrisoma camini TaxID=1035120 RepID=UPI00046D4F02|nr:LarC family nickel insertion protein [Deferrisoma camini]
MKRILYLDAGAGVSGDMFVGALLDAGASLDVVRDHVGSLGVEGLRLEARKVSRRGVTGTKFDVLDPETRAPVDQAPSAHPGHHHGGRHHGHGHHHHPRRGLREILAIIGEAPLPEPVTRDAAGVFRLLAAAEARVHGTSPDEVHFHEVGALDAIADIVAACSAFHQLGVDEAWCSPVHVGCGTVRCAHGVLPVPAPATAEILRGVPVYSDGTRGELTTPTGAALIRYFCKGFGPMPPLEMDRSGRGAGSRDYGILNMLRAVVGVLIEDEVMARVACAG